MQIDELYENPADALVHLEQYANKGSPSGFLAERATSNSTSPASPFPFFDLPLLCVPIEYVEIYQASKIPAPVALTDDANSVFYPCHPNILEEVRAQIPVCT